MTDADTITTDEATATTDEATADRLTGQDIRDAIAGDLEILARWIPNAMSENVTYATFAWTLEQIAFYADRLSRRAAILAGLEREILAATDKAVSGAEISA